MRVSRILILLLLVMTILGVKEKTFAGDRCGEGIYRPVVEIREIKDNTNHVITEYEILNYCPTYFQVRAYVSQPFKCRVDDIYMNLFIPAKSPSSILWKSLKAGQVNGIGSDIYTSRLEYSVPSPPFLSTSHPLGEVQIRVDAHFMDRFSDDETSWGSPPFRFYVDTVPPTLSINSPAEGTVVKGGTEGFQIDVTANDDVGIKDFTIKVDGIVRETINAREDKPTLRQWLRARVYGTERRMITVVAKDKVDRTAERTFTVYSDDAPPTISNVWPQPAPLDDPHRVSLRTSQSMVPIRADIVDRGMAGVKEVRLLDETGRILVTRNRPYEGNTYILDYTRPAGARNIVCYIQAFDKVGNMSRTNMITIIWEEAPPAPPGGGIKKEPIKPIIPKQPAIKPTVK